MAKSVFAMQMKGNVDSLADQEWTFTFKGLGRGSNGENVTAESDVVMSAEGFKETASIV